MRRLRNDPATFRDTTISSLPTFRGKPLTVGRIVRSVRGRLFDGSAPLNSCRGVYSSFAEATRAAPPSKPVGYDAANSADWYLAKLDSLAPAYLLRRRTGDLVGLATQDVETVEYFYAHTVAPAVVAPQASSAVARVASAIVVEARSYSFHFARTS